MVFERRRVGPEDGADVPHPAAPAGRRAAQGSTLGREPPDETGEFRAPDLVELTALDPTIKLDIRYATTNNFLGTVFYPEPRAFLQRPAAEALVRAHRKLRKQGYGLLMHDAYRPWHVTKMFWDATPDDKKIFVADPAKGSRHNRGSAVDLRLYDLKTGKPVEMVGGYDEFTDRSYPDYPGGTSLQRWHRDLLRDAMEAEGFTVYESGVVALRLPGLAPVPDRQPAVSASGVGTVGLIRSRNRVDAAAARRGALPCRAPRRA